MLFQNAIGIEKGFLFLRFNEFNLQSQHQEALKYVDSIDSVAFLLTKANNKGFLLLLK